MIGPTISPIFEATVQKKTTQIRPWELNMSSILPPTIVLGTAESNPANVRMITAPVRDFDNPITRQQTQLRPLLKIYIFLRPKDSVQGGNRMVPMDWPRRKLTHSKF
jgi:hypothetical protein